MELRRLQPERGAVVDAGALSSPRCSTRTAERVGGVTRNKFRARAPTEPRNLVPMSVVEQPEPPAVAVVSAADALRLARPLPSPEELAIEGLTIEEWQALMDALADA